LTKIKAFKNMRRLLHFALLLTVTLPITALKSQTIYPKREFRAAWISTVFNVDYPSSSGLTTAQQKAEFITQLNNLKLAGCNAVFVQVRPASDAFYASPFEPWSEWLEGTQNVAPSPYYDPLAFYVSECKKRGMELHAWFNPYRAGFSTNAANYSSNHVANAHPTWCLNYDGKKFLNPGLSAVRDYVTSIVMDVVRRYDIDGVHFDDYFYPYPNAAAGAFPDAATFTAYPRGFTNLSNWRRDNVNLMINKVHDSIKAVKPYIRFGVSPFGIYQNGVPAGITGLSSYDDIYCDPVNWLQNNNVDYILPQLYWKIGGAQDFNTLATWWGNKAALYNRDCFVGLATYRMAVASGDWSNLEIKNQINHTRTINNNVPGICYFSSTSILNNFKLLRDTLRLNSNKFRSLCPPMIWDNAVAPNNVNALTHTVNASNVTLNWSLPTAAADGGLVHYNVIYRFPQGTTVDLTNPRYIVGRTNQDTTAYVDNVVMTTGQQFTYVVTSLDRFHNESSGVTRIVCNNCTPPDNVAPTSTVAVAGTWQTANFTANFADQDDASGSGIEKGYYNVEQLQNGEWRSNGSRGFLNDAFSGATLNTDWSSPSAGGTWSINANALMQTDEAIGNTNLWTRVKQDLSNVYVYDFNASMGGAGTNRRVGIHIFADDSIGVERGNSLLIVFRQDNQNIQLYRPTNNVLGVTQATQAFPFVANTIYNFKLVYDRTNGLLKVFVNGTLTLTHTYSAFLTTGKYVSFRSGNAILTVNDIKIMRSRATSASISIGAANTNDVVEQNPNPTTPSGKINTISKDNADNFSTLTTQTFNVDYTAPILSPIVNDGSAADIDTLITATTVQGNYPAATDIHSGITNYEYAIGTTAGATNLLPFTSTSALNFSNNFPSLIDGQQYYVTIKALNGAGLISGTTSSDGFKYLLTQPVDTTGGPNIGLNVNDNNAFVVFPNPFTNSISIQSTVLGKVDIKVIDASGKTISKLSQVGFENGKIEITQIEGSNGVYFIHITSGEETQIIKVLKVNK
jgi:uncharacterized lipoprotein YddW (UPF0748 family)